jgi:hypothetical protein
MAPSGTGGGIFNWGSLTLSNTIVANQSGGGDCFIPPDITSNGHNLESGTSCGFTGTGDLQNANPLLGALADNGGPTQNMALLPGSPAIDVGSCEQTTDQRGIARPQGATCDIGAYERLDTSTFIPVACGDGQIDSVIDGFENASLWSGHFEGSGVSIPTLSNTTGCSPNSGSSMAINYNLSASSISDGWFVITRTFIAPANLSNYSHLRIGLKGSDPNAHHTFQIKLVNHVGGLDYTYWRAAESVTDLPVWRPLYIDFKEFTCFGDTATICSSPPPLDLAAITRIEIAVSKCVSNGNECEPSSENANILYLDELAVVDLRPGAGNRLVQTSIEQVVPNPDLRSSTAGAILNHQDSTSLIPAWFGESTPNYNTYAEAVALHVFVDEYERTGGVNYRDTANSLADKLMSLQIPDGKANAGGWYTAYKPDGSGGIVPMDGSCTGDESLTPDIDRCAWVGNTGWATMALVRLKNSGIYPNATQLNSSIDKAATWMVSQVGRITEYPGLVTVGMEGNISTYFGLVAAGKDSEASQLGNKIYQYGWDSTEKRMKIGAAPSDYATAIDVSGSWGAQFLRHIGRADDALSSQEFAASILRTTSFDANNFANAIVEGYGDIVGPWTMTVEFGGQAAAAGMLYANKVMEQIYLLQQPDGSFPDSTDNWYGGTVPPWTTTMTGVAPTAWVYFAQNGDPLSTTPDAFIFTDQTGVATSTLITSSAITVNGINIAAPISISSCTGTNCAYSTDNGSTWQTSAGAVADSNQVKVRMTSSALYSTTSDLTLNMGGTTDTFSVTTAEPTYTVTYDGNGNTGGAVPTDAGTYAQSATVTVQGNTGALVKTSYTFNVWNTAANGSGIARAAASTFSMGAANVTLYAQWTLAAVAPGAPTIGTATPLNTSARVAFTPGAIGTGTLVNYTASCSTNNVNFISNTGSASPITVSGLSNGVAYTCKVKTTSTVGDSPWSALSGTVTPSTVPGAPTIGAATAGYSSAMVAFTPPASNGGAMITSYSATSTPGSLSGSCNAPCTSITVNGLTNGTTYTFTVTAHNSAGNSAPSAASNSVKPAKTVPGAPTIGAATAGNAQATVTFTPPASSGGSTITQYKATSSPGNRTGSCSAPCTSIKISYLTNGTAYTFRVTARNAIGVGAASSPSNSVTPAKVPGAPRIGRATAGNASATVTFTAPASNGGAAIDGYTVTSTPAGGVDSNRVGQAGSTGLSHRITGLVNGTYYTFKVTAHNRVGTGAASWSSNRVKPSATAAAAASDGNAVSPYQPKNDLNGDGLSDILWYNTNGATTVWLMDGATMTSSAALLADPGWVIAGSGDFDGDGKADILWRNPSDGTVNMWRMDGASATSTATLLADPLWDIAGVGDFDGDGKADILLRRANDGAVNLWLMDGAAATPHSALLADPLWDVAGIGDFNGDGKADILMRRPTDGTVNMWLMDGAAVTTNATLLADPKWDVAGTGDFNGDGKADILMRRQSDGTVNLWQMDGAHMTSTATLLADPKWDVVGSGDFDGDGKADILMRHPSDGTVAMWLMDGASMKSSAVLLADPAWRPVGMQ